MRRQKGKIPTRRKRQEQLKFDRAAGRRGSVLFYRKERGNESDQGETAEKNVTYIILKELFRKRGYANESN